MPCLCVVLKQEELLCLLFVKQKRLKKHCRGSEMGLAEWGVPRGRVAASVRFVRHRAEARH
jgi:hypothetical protein